MSFLADGWSAVSDSTGLLSHEFLWLLFLLLVTADVITDHTGTTGLPSHESSWTSFHVSIDLIFFIQQRNKLQFIVHTNCGSIAIFHGHPLIKVGYDTTRNDTRVGMKEDMIVDYDEESSRGE